jgi:hypothetical protein
MKRPAWSFSKPAFQSWAEHFPDHGEFLPLAEEAVMAAPEGSRLAKALFEPGGSHQGQTIHFPEQL